MNDQTNHKDNEVLPLQAQRLEDLISSIMDCCQDRMIFQCKSFGLPQAELKCLRLFGQDRYLTTKGISRSMEVAKSRVTIIVDGLVQKGFVERTNDPNDARVVLLSLTPEGRRKHQEISSFMEQMPLRILGKIEFQERNNVLTSLEKLRAAMQTVKELMV